LNKYKKKVYKKTKNLLTGETEQDAEYQKVQSICTRLSYQLNGLFRLESR